MAHLPRWALFPAAAAAGMALAGEQVYLAPQAFVAQAFGQVPEPRVLWLTDDIRTQVAEILGHEPTQLRQRYWAAGGRTAWILEEIGKEAPITAGFVVAGGRIEQARVLIYRESRGGEVRYPAFLQQYAHAGLTAEGRLDKPIDGIAGATLSVAAMERMARVALTLDRAARSR
ncbi:MAG TPA: FMN-binding protein [Burkholderiales bacterium]